jgi:hypothetical protein
VDLLPPHLVTFIAAARLSAEECLPKLLLSIKHRKKSTETSEKPADDLSVIPRKRQKREKMLPGVIYLLISYQQSGSFFGARLLSKAHKSIVEIVNQSRDITE